jgi:hypothetical protein
MTKAQPEQLLPRNERIRKAWFRSSAASDSISGDAICSRDGVPMHLGARVLDILCVLVSAKGDVVTKDELMARVWQAS